MFSFDFLTTITKSWTSLIIWGIVILVVVLVIRHFSNKINNINKEVDEINKKDKILIYQHMDEEKLRTEELKEPKNKKETKGEKKCREVFETIFQKPFEKIRPDFIKNDCTEKPLEIDGYNEELKLGFEYQGVQHYKYTPYFHKSHNDFEKQQYRDNLKREECKKIGIKVIEIPYTVEIDDIKEFIVKKLKEEGVLIDN